MFATPREVRYVFRDYFRVPHGRDYMWHVGRCLCYRVSTRPILLIRVPRLYYGLKLGQRVKRPL